MTVVASHRMAIAVAALLLGAGISMAQLQGPATIKGVVKDAVTGNPVGCKIDIIEPDGKKFTSKANDITGAYLLIVNSPGTVKLTARGFNVERKELTVTVPVNRGAQTIEQDLVVNGFTQGKGLMSARAFELNAPALTASASADLAKLKDYLRVNNELRVNIMVSPDIDQTATARAAATAEYQRLLAAWKKEVAALKKKKATEFPAEPVMPADIADPNMQLVADRISTLKALLADVNNADLRVTYMPQPLPASAAAPAPVAVPAQPEAAAPAKKGKKAVKAEPAKAATPQAPKTTTHPTLVIEIGKVKPLFN